MCPYIRVIIPTYSLLAFLGFSITVIMVFFRIDTYKISFKDFLQLILCLVLGCFLGSKILFAITQIPTLLQEFSIRRLLYLLPGGGFVFYGGLFGALLAVHLFVKKKKVYKSKDVYNLVVPAFALFHAFGRIGCFMSGCCYGKLLNQPVILFDFVKVNRYPVQIFEALYEVVLFIILNKLYKRNQDINLLKIYLISYASFRFVIEFLRGDEVRGIIGGVSTSQWISLTILLVYLGKYFFERKRESNEER